MDKNMNNIIKLVEECVILITNEYDYYIIEDNEIFIDLGLVKCPYCHDLIDIYGYCYC
jgi:hypothetical protein